MMEFAKDEDESVGAGKGNWAWMEGRLSTGRRIRTTGQRGGIREFREEGRVAGLDRLPKSMRGRGRARAWFEGEFEQRGAGREGEGKWRDGEFGNGK